MPPVSRPTFPSPEEHICFDLEGLQGDVLIYSFVSCNLRCAIRLENFQIRKTGNCVLKLLTAAGASPTKPARE